VVDEELAQLRAKYPEIFVSGETKRQVQRDLEEAIEAAPKNRA
jgi:hypothetical protein